MKHFHPSLTTKKDLAHQIYNETQFLLEIQKEWAKYKNIAENPAANYGTVRMAQIKLVSLKKEEIKQKAKIEDLQQRHDNIKE